MEEQKPGVGFGVVILKEGKVLLGKRENDWAIPGGKLKFGETFEEGARRKAVEETGLKLKESKVFCINNDKIENAHFVTVGLLSENFEGEPQVAESKEISEWKWFDMEDLPFPIYFPSAKVLNNYRKNKFYIPERIF